ncbi:N-acyl homoserine lactonase family protein [Tranquillimonas alkanivorans]|uniref:N-acyl homoserine lactone hydrolase n=1 Tax=Tranquillimonas alkanivorans TaxID=441119 RepID=A0A1I5UMJ1_9RHOB|nr:N-acyl homoserine lactonase family protein [Tranquillimonas alkanivorans]SFP96455.1 N-acyl homoserine lactone hydrolase [Tranquillimonas alkanivorans]
MDELKLLKGRPERLYVLDFGFFRVHAGPRDIGIVGFLVTTDAGERVLIDSGFPAKYAEDADRATEEDALGAFGNVLSLTHENLPKGQLAKACVRPEDIDLFILTHTHIDHLGGLFDFPQAPMLISERERALPKPLYWTGGQPWDWPEREYVTLADDTRIGPGFEVLQAPGHAPGQLAMMIELPNTGPVLIVSDAISRPSEIEERFDTAPDPELALDSARRLMRLAEERGAFVIYGHGPEQWPELRKAPEFYD